MSMYITVICGHCDNAFSTSETCDCPYCGFTRVIIDSD